MEATSVTLHNLLGKVELTFFCIVRRFSMIATIVTIANEKALAQSHKRKMFEEVWSIPRGSIVSGDCNLRLEKVHYKQILLLSPPVHAVLTKHFHPTQVCILPFSNIEKRNKGAETYPEANYNFMFFSIFQHRLSMIVVSI